MSFPNPLRVELLRGRSWSLLAPFSYRDYEVPAGFVTDFASTKPVRRVAIYGLALALLLTLLPWQWLAWSAYGIGLTCLLLYALIAGVGNQAATVHDWLYTTGKVSRQAADRIFRQALLETRVHPLLAWILWAGVRLGGHWRYCAKP